MKKKICDNFGLRPESVGLVNDTPPSKIASEKFTELVKDAQRRQGLDYNTAWRYVQRTSEGQALMAKMGS